jgi:hypothetical protein
VTLRKRKTGSTPENSLWKCMDLPQDRLHNGKYKYICHLVPLFFEVTQALFFPSVRERKVGNATPTATGGHVDRRRSPENGMPHRTKKHAKGAFTWSLLTHPPTPHPPFTKPRVFTLLRHPCTLLRTLIHPDSLFHESCIKIYGKSVAAR